LLKIIIWLKITQVHQDRYRLLHLRGREYRHLLKKICLLLLVSLQVFLLFLFLLFWVQWFLVRGFLAIQLAFFLLFAPSLVSRFQYPTSQDQINSTPNLTHFSSSRHQISAWHSKFLTHVWHSKFLTHVWHSKYLTHAWR